MKKIKMAYYGYAIVVLTELFFIADLCIFILCSFMLFYMDQLSEINI